MDEYRLTNLRNWDSRAPVHAGSRNYNLDGLAADAQRLSKVVSRDAPFLGDLTGLDVVHLQCHIGHDTLSLARLGGRVTGVDFSPASVEVARNLAVKAGIDIRFVLSELYAVGEQLGADFDLVYTGVGALNWLPDIAGWARVASNLLRPGGRLYVREAHPMLCTLDDERADDALVVTLPYFESEAPNRWDTPTTYADDLPIEETVTFEWNHGLGQIVQAVIDAGLQVRALREHDWIEWKALPHMIENEDGVFVLPNGRDRVPLMFTLEAQK